MDKSLRESHLTLWIRVPLCTLMWNLAGLWQMEPRGRWETDSCLPRAPWSIPGTRWGSRHYARGANPPANKGKASVAGPVLLLVSARSAGQWWPGHWHRAGTAGFWSLRSVVAKASATTDGAAGHGAELPLSGLPFLVKLRLSELRQCVRITALVLLGLRLLPWTGREVLISH